MQKFVLKLAGLGLVLTALFFTACGDDPVVVDPLGPAITLAPDPGFLAGDSDVIINEDFSVRVRLSTGDAQLRDLVIMEGGSDLSTDRFTINGGAIVSNNPLAFFGTDKDGVTLDLTISPSGTEQVGDFITYAFTVTADDGEKASTDIVISIADVPGTPITTTLTGILFNQAGPAGTGGLDLDTGDGTGSSDASAELRDLGIDCTIPQTMENWRAQFGTVNGAEMVKVDQNQLENFNFDDVSITETIVDVYNNNSTALDNGISTNPQCDETTVTDVATGIAVNDLYIVFANDTYYLIRVDAINFVLEDDPNTAGIFENNEDNYVLSVKF